MENLSPELRHWISDELFDAAPVLIAVIDREFNMVRANPSFERTFGEWQRRKCYEVYKDRDTVCPECHAADSLGDGRNRVSRETGIDDVGNVTVYVKHTVPIVREDGSIPFLVEMSIDVTDVELLRYEKEQLFEQVPCNMAVLDSELRVVQANSRIEALFGEVTGRYCWEVFKRKEKPCDHCPAQHTLDDGGIHTGHQQAQNAQGEVVHLQVTTAPIGLPEDESKYVLEMAVDISELKNLEAEKLEAERLAAVGQTVAGLAHGVKNLLTGLEGGMYLISTGIKKDNRKRLNQGWEMLDRNIVRISKFVKDFLAYSKGRTITAEPADPVAVAREVVSLYAQRAREAGVQLDFEPGGDIAAANLDYDAMHDCLTNLVGNAIDACQMSEDAADLHVVVRVCERDDAVVYEVQDNGVGMDYEIKRKVFTTFFTTKGLGGTGLGLLTTRKIVQEHGGTVELESEPGEGTTFRIELPRSRLPRAAVAVEQAS